MCEANAYMIQNGREDLILSDVDLVQPVGEEEWHLVSIYGEQMTLRARLHHMSLDQHKLFFAP